MCAAIIRYEKLRRCLCLPMCMLMLLLWLSHGFLNATKGLHCANGMSWHDTTRDDAKHQDNKQPGKGSVYVREEEEKNAK